MRILKSSKSATAISAVALFAALGGTSWASGTLIGSSQIANGAVTSAKIGHHQVKTANLASGAVTSSKLAPGSVTSTAVAPNTFLAANGTAADSNELGGKPASDYVQGGGSVTGNSFELSSGQSRLLVNLGVGYVDGNCLAGGKPQLSYTAEVAPVNLIDWSTTFGGASTLNTTNGLSVGNSYNEPNSTGLPQQVTFQAAANGQVATAWTTGQDIGGASCLFTGVALNAS
jgi:hypothetical protein